MRLPDPGPRSPVDVPEESGGIDVRAGVDTDSDGHPDTVLVADGDELLLHTDLDGDGLADQVLGIGPDGVAREVAPPWSGDSGSGDSASGDVLGGLLDGAGAAP